nr:hypothetical protein [Tanacetum cinerariifolium]
MLADSKMPTTFWAEAVNTGCYTTDSPLFTTSKSSQDNEFQPSNYDAKRVDEDLSKENKCNDQGEEDSTNSTNRVNIVTSNINAASSSGVNDVGTNISIGLPPDPNMPSLEDIGIFEDSHDDEDVFSVEVDSHNLDFTFQNEFSSTMAFAIICLANNQKFNFSKYILDNLKKNLEASVPFYMFPRFIQVFMDHQLGDMSYHKGDLPTNVQDTPIPDAPSSSQPHRKQNPRRKENKETEVSPTEIHTKDHVPITSNNPLPSDEDRMQLKELMDLCINLSNKVLDLENEVIEMKSSHKVKIEEL